jgi:hypothetical protein
MNSVDETRTNGTNGAAQAGAAETADHVDGRSLDAWEGDLHGLLRHAADRVGLILADALDVDDGAITVDVPRVAADANNTIHIAMREVSTFCANLSWGTVDGVGESPVASVMQGKAPGSGTQKVDEETPNDISEQLDEIDVAIVQFEGPMMIRVKSDAEAMAAWLRIKDRLRSLRHLAACLRLDAREGGAS